MVYPREVAICIERGGGLDTELLTDDLDLLEAGGFSSGEIFLRSYLATYTDVELDLGLRARGTDGYLRPVSCLVLEYIAGRRHVEREDLALVEPEALELGVVEDLDDGASCESLEGILTEVLHHSFDLFGTALTLADYADALVLVEAILYEDLLEELVDGHTTVGSPCSELGEHTAGRY